jgi:hypothetical protein
MAKGMGAYIHSSICTSAVYVISEAALLKQGACSPQLLNLRRFKGKQKQIFNSKNVTIFPSGHCA